MPSLVEELKQDALNTTVPVTALLQKALIVAYSLDLPEFGEWVEHELYGYQDADVPDYRMTRGRIMIHGHFCDAPVVFGDPEIEKAFCTFEYRVPIGPIEQMSSQAKTFLVVDLPADEQTLLKQMFPNANGVAQLHLQASCVSVILDRVRNLILKWSLKLIREGIVGNGTEFSADEMQRAARQAALLGGPVIYIHGDVINSAIQQGSPAAIQAVTRRNGV